MKKQIFTSILIILSTISFAQSVDDALRYSRTNLSGTAKYVSMGGAMSALGGDISAIADNPASLGVFMYSEINFTPSLYHSNNETEYLGNTRSDNRYNFNINNVGFVISSGVDNKDWKAINYSFSYKRLDNYHHNIYAEGINTQNSITDFFAESASGVSLYDIYHNNNTRYVGDNAYNTYLIDPVNSTDSNQTEYKSFYNAYGETQMHSIQTTGRRDSWSFSAGTNYKNKLYIGASLDFSNITYTYVSLLQEHNNSGTIDNFKSMQYSNEYSTSGSGLAFKIGFILKPYKWLRMSYAFHTPINYNLTDEYSHNVESWGIKANGDTKSRNSKSPLGDYNYNIITPLKMNAGLAFVLGKKAVIGLEYQCINYSQINIKPVGSIDDFSTENAQIRDIFKPSHNGKVGFEYRLGQLALRTGISYFDSPYKYSQVNKDAYTLHFSGGLGFNVDFFYLDLAYSYGYSNYDLFPYQLESSETSSYKITQTTQKYILTMGVRF